MEIIIRKIIIINNIKTQGKKTDDDKSKQTESMQKIAEK